MVTARRSCLHSNSPSATSTFSAFSSLRRSTAASSSGLPPSVWFKTCTIALGTPPSKPTRKMQLAIGKATYVFSQSHIVPSVWTIVKGSITSEGVGGRTWS